MSLSFCIIVIYYIVSIISIVSNYSKYLITEFGDGLQITPKNWLISEKQAKYSPVMNILKYDKMCRTMYEPSNSFVDIIRVLASYGLYF